METEPCIMVIEDSREIRELFCDMLTDAGYAVALYSTPTAALADLDRLKPDLIVLDWLFDREALGLQVLQTLRLRSRAANLPVVVCSAATRQLQDLQSFLETRGVMVVYKPFCVDDLLDAIDTALKRAGTPAVGLPAGAAG